ncbi:protein kinase [Zalerion maritima]|uniref:Protein kinase n=1 Tax=Zalerion maritima TaxID=339359 RepID=A0AAD5RS71_9PEZI|nr:protein kinase [Zalerion maritima]
MHSENLDYGFWRPEGLEFPGQHNPQLLQYLPWSPSTFDTITDRFFIHGSMARTINRGSNAEFKRTHVAMGAHHSQNANTATTSAAPGPSSPPPSPEEAIVYSTRTSSLWPSDLALSQTFFPRLNVVYAVLFGCDPQTMSDVEGRLRNSEGACCHPLLLPGIVAELERNRQRKLVKEDLKKLTKVTNDLSEVTPEDWDEDAMKEKNAGGGDDGGGGGGGGGFGTEGLGWAVNSAGSFVTMPGSGSGHGGGGGNASGNSNNIALATNTTTTTTATATATATTTPAAGATTPFEAALALEAGPSETAGPQSATEAMSRWMEVHHLKNGLQSWQSRLREMIAHMDELDRTVYAPAPANAAAAAAAAQPPPPAPEDAKRKQRAVGLRIKERLEEILEDYEGYIRSCVMNMDGMTLATSLAHTKANMAIALSAKRDSSQMKSIALLTMVFLPATFMATFFSMTFFEWKPPPATPIVSKWIWMYFVFTAVVTAVTIGLWNLFANKRHQRLRRWVGGIPGRLGIVGGAVGGGMMAMLRKRKSA